MSSRLSMCACVCAFQASYLIVDRLENAVGSQDPVRIISSACGVHILCTSQIIALFESLTSPFFHHPFYAVTVCQNSVHCSVSYILSPGF